VLSTWDPGSELAICEARLMIAACVYVDTYVEADALTMDELRDFTAIWAELRLAVHA
jgi:hypothetical protein